MKNPFSFSTDAVHVLLADPDTNYSMLLAETLEREECRVEVVNSSDKAKKRIQNKRYDFLLVSDQLTQPTTLELLTLMHDLGLTTPIYIICAKNDKTQFVEYYRNGADDVLVKPFSTDILVWKMSVLLERLHKREYPQQTNYTFGIYNFDTNSQLLVSENQSLKLSTREADLLTLLVQNINQVVDRSIILQRIWYSDNYFNARSLSVYINRLRNKLAEDDNIQILSVHGKGYKLIQK